MDNKTTDVQNVETKVNSRLRLMPDIKSRKIWIEINLALLVMSVVVNYIGFLSLDDENDLRRMIGAVLSALWILSFSMLSNNVERTMQGIALYIIKLVFSVGILTFIYITFIDNKFGKAGWADILASTLGVIAFVIIWDMFLDMLEVFINIVKKVQEFLFPKLKKNLLGFQNVITFLTAFVVTCTGLGSSIYGLVQVIKQILAN